MKRVISIFLAILTTLSLCSVSAFADESDTPAPQKYVEDIYAYKCSGDDVDYYKQQLAASYESQELEYVIRDVNLNHGNDDDYIIFSYFYTTDATKALTGLLLHVYPNFFGVKDELVVDNVVYYKNSNDELNDLNSGNGGDYVDIFTTKSHQTGKLITDIGFKTSDGIIDGDESWKDVPGYNLDSAVNLNSGSKKTTKAIYMTYDSVADEYSEELNSTYVAKVFMNSGDSETARDQLEQTLIENDLGHGYELFSYNLNEKTTGKHVYLGYVFTKDIKDAITGVMLASVKNGKVNDRYIYNEDNTVKYERIDNNFNEGNKGDTINLYVTYDSATGKALNKLGLQVGRETNSSVVYTFLQDESWTEVSEYGDEDDTIDLNDGANGEYIYLWNHYSAYTAETEIKFVKDIYVKVGADLEEVYRAMDEELSKTGLEYDYSPFDLNKGTDGSVIIIGWTFTDDVKEAITDVMLHHSSRDDALEDEFVRDDVTFTKLPVNLKEGNEKGFAYLYTARDENSETALTNLGIEAYNYKLFSKSVKYFAESAEWKSVSTYANEQKYDLNDGNGGYYIYLWKELSMVNGVEDSTDTSTDDPSDSDNSDSDTDIKPGHDSDSDSDDPTDIDEVVYGDVTGDGKVTMEDVTSIQRVVAKLSTFRPSQREKADVTDDGKVNMEDITYIQRYIAKLITKFPADKYTMYSYN
ncbi:MAG: dockerin type I repeat-containing protein [Clostridia bacterium]|nr:dockerin type I repeat-containing protein [Clostridia bacterium]